MGVIWPFQVPWTTKKKVLLDKPKKIMHLKEDPDLPSIRQCTPIFGFHFPWRSQHIFCQIQVCHLGLLLQLHWIFTTHTMSKTIPIYQNMTSMKKLNARIRVKHVIWNTDWVCRKWMCDDMCMLEDFHMWNYKELKGTCSIQFRFLLMTYSKMWSWKAIARTYVHVSDISVYEMQTFSYTNLTVDSIKIHFLV